MRRLNAILFFPVLLTTLFLAGCVISPRVGSGGTSTTGVGHLYVSNQSANGILTFAGATGDTGDIAPTANISGTQTGLNNPQYIFSDNTNDALYVANPGSSNILVFDGVSTLSGNVNSSPARAISSQNLAQPIDVALDSVRDLLYVADNGVVDVFGSASTATGTVPASAILQLGFTPSAILLDSANNRLYVANSTGNAVAVFDNASTLNGSVAAPRTLVGPNNTQLNGPSGLQLDGAGRLYVSNTGSVSINIYANAATVSGDVAPVAKISGSNTTLSAPAQITLDPISNSGEIYIADFNANEIVVFSNITSLTQAVNPTPNRSISGASTLLTGARGVALDKTH